MSGKIKDKAVDPLQFDGPENKWSEHQWGFDNVHTTIINALQDIAPNISGKKVLEIGCGLGWLTSALMEAGTDVIGIDPSEKNIRKAMSLYPQVKFQKVQLMDYETVDQFDYVICVGVFEYLDRLEDQFAKVKSLLKPSAKFILFTIPFEPDLEVKNIKIEKEEVGPGEIARSINTGASMGIQFEINREVQVYVDRAKSGSLKLSSQKELMFRPGGRVMYNLLVFETADPLNVTNS